MPPPRIQSDPTRGQPEDGDHGVSLCPGLPPPASLSPSAPPNPASQQEDTNEDKWLLYKVSISDSSILYRAGHAPPSTAFSIAPPPPPAASHLHKMLGKVKSLPLHALLPTTTNLLLLLFETCSSVSLFIRGVLEGENQNKTKRLGRQAWKSCGNQPWKWGGNANGSSRCVNPNFLNPKSTDMYENSGAQSVKLKETG